MVNFVTNFQKLIFQANSKMYVFNNILQYFLKKLNNWSSFCIAVSAEFKRTEHLTNR